MVEKRPTLSLVTWIGPTLGAPSHRSRTAGPAETSLTRRLGSAGVSHGGDHRR